MSAVHNTAKRRSNPAALPKQEIARLAAAQQDRRDQALTAYLCRLIEPELMAFTRLPRGLEAGSRAV